MQILKTILRWWQGLTIPKEIDNKEKIARAIFSPININEKTKTLKSNAFKPPAGSQEISVTRLDYSGGDFCKAHGISIQKPESNRNFFGLGVLTCEEIKSSECEIKYSPIHKSNRDFPKNKFHSDILLGYIVEKGKPLPSIYNLKVKSLADKSILHIDPQPGKKEWGEDNF